MSKKPTPKTGRLEESDLIARGYKHIVRGTLRFDYRSNKQIVTIRCFGPDGKYDGTTRRIYTSDLHQCAWLEKMKPHIAIAKRKEIIEKLHEQAV